jgi:hypothetical protein
MLFAPAGRLRSGAARCRFSKTLKIHVFQLFIESGSKLPHSEGVDGGAKKMKLYPWFRMIFARSNAILDRPRRRKRTTLNV